jgi:hypothetical protein
MRVLDGIVGISKTSGEIYETASQSGYFKVSLQLIEY